MRAQQGGVGWGESYSELHYRYESALAAGKPHAEAVAQGRNAHAQAEEHNEEVYFSLFDLPPGFFRAAVERIPSEKTKLAWT